MSRKNIVNPDHYKTGGRLTPDELAQERRKQAEPLFGPSRSGRRATGPPWKALEVRHPEPAVTARRSSQAARKNRAESGARSSGAKARATPKTSGARGTPKTGSAPRARGSAARAASPERTGSPGAHKSASHGRGKSRRRS